MDLSSYLPNDLASRSGVTTATIGGSEVGEPINVDGEVLAQERSRKANTRSRTTANTKAAALFLVERLRDNSSQFPFFTGANQRSEQAVAFSHADRARWEAMGVV
jgi:hypothetical protein